MFERTKAPTKYIAGFKTRRNLNLALQRHRTTMVGIWVQHFDPLQLPEVTAEHYARDRSRSSNLTANGPNLAVGHEAWYLRFDTSASFESFLDWYSAQ